jgi:hypothetical protein
MQAGLITAGPGDVLLLNNFFVEQTTFFLYFRKQDLIFAP